MIRSKQYKYIAFRDCEDLAFDMETDPDEQRNLLKHDPDNADLKALREAVLDGFDFDEVEALREKQTAEFARQISSASKNANPQSNSAGRRQIGRSRYPSVRVQSNQR